MRAFFAILIVSSAIILASVYYIMNRKIENKEVPNTVIDLANSIEYKKRKIVSYKIIDSVEIENEYRNIRYVNSDTIIAYQSQTKAYCIIDLKNKTHENYGNYYTYDLEFSGDTINTIQLNKKSNLFTHNTYVQNDFISQTIFDKHQGVGFALFPDTKSYVLGINKESDSVYLISLNNLKDGKVNPIDISLSNVFKKFNNVNKPSFFDEVFWGHLIKRENNFFYKNSSSSYGMVYNLLDSSYKIFRTIDSFEFPKIIFTEVSGGRLATVDNSYSSTIRFVVSDDFLLNLYSSHEHKSVSYIDFYDKDSLTYSYSLVFNNSMGVINGMDIDPAYPNEMILINSDNKIFKIKIENYAAENF